MITVNIRRQGGAAIMTIPADVLKVLNIEIGTSLELDVSDGAFVARPAHKSQHKRYSLAELMRGVTSEMMTGLNSETEWARDGDSVGRELA